MKPARPRRPRRPRQKPLPPDWRLKHELPSAAELERLSRVDGHLADGDQGAEQREFNLGDDGDINSAMFPYYSRSPRLPKQPSST